MTARIAEASSTALPTLGFLSPLGKKFVHERYPGLQIPPRTALRPLNAALHCRDPQFVVLDAQDDLVTRLNPERLAECCWDHYAPVFVDPHLGLWCHDISFGI